MTAAVLLVQTTYDGHHWHLPGGYVEANESPEETVVRELKEELDLTVEVLGLSCVAYKAYDPILVSYIDAGSFHQGIQCRMGRK